MGVYPKLIRSLCQTRGLQTTSGPPSLFKWPAKGVQLFFHQNINTNKISKNSLFAASCKTWSIKTTRYPPLYAIQKYSL